MLKNAGRIPVGILTVANHHAEGQIAGIVKMTWHIGVSRYFIVVLDGVRTLDIAPMALFSSPDTEKVTVEGLQLPVHGNYLITPLLPF